MTPDQTQPAPEKPSMITHATHDPTLASRRYLIFGQRLEPTAEFSALHLLTIVDTYEEALVVVGSNLSQSPQIVDIKYGKSVAVTINGRLKYLNPKTQMWTFQFPGSLD